MKCPYCSEVIFLNMVQYYPEVLFECGCGTVIDSAGKDKTDEYYNLDQGLSVRKRG